MEENILIKTYEFRSGLKCRQEELDIEQDTKISAAIKKANLGIDDIKELGKLPILETIQKLLEKGILFELLEIILLPEDGTSGEEFKKLIKKIKNSELPEVFNDFFTLNPALEAVSNILNELLAGMNNVKDTNNTASILDDIRSNLKGKGKDSA
jgi:hypothetical protein